MLYIIYAIIIKGMALYNIRKYSLNFKINLEGVEEGGG